MIFFELVDLDDFALPLREDEGLMSDKNEVFSGIHTHTPIGSQKIFLLLVSIFHLREKRGWMHAKSKYIFTGFSLSFEANSSTILAPIKDYQVVAFGL